MSVDKKQSGSRRVGSGAHLPVGRHRSQHYDRSFPDRHDVLQSDISKTKMTKGTPKQQNAANKNVSERAISSVIELSEALGSAETKIQQLEQKLRERDQEIKYLKTMSRGKHAATKETERNYSMYTSAESKVISLEKLNMKSTGDLADAHHTIYHLEKRLEEEKDKVGHLSKEVMKLKMTCHDSQTKSQPKFSELSCNNMVCGNTNVVELSETRPEKLAQRFSNSLHSNLFAAAFIDLTEDPYRYSEDRAATYLFNLLTAVYYECLTLFDSQKRNLGENINEIQRNIAYPTFSGQSAARGPYISTHISIPSYSKPNDSLADKLAGTITQGWMNPTKATFDHLHKTVYDRLRECHKLDGRGQRVASFVKESVYIVWLLLTRDPPLELVFRSPQPMSASELFVIRKNKNTSPDSSTLHYLWPALREKNGKVLLRGEARRIPTSKSVLTMYRDS